MLNFKGWLSGLGAAPGANFPHRHQRATLTPSELKGLVARDYSQVPLGHLEPDEVRSPGEPAEHMVKLRQDVEAKGIMRPIVVYSQNGRRFLADGHHRAVLAVNMGINCPAVIIECDCVRQTICTYVLSFCSEMHALTIEDGWNWVSQKSIRKGKAV